MIKLLSNKNLRIYLLFLPLTFLLAYLGLKYASFGLLHYGSFVLGIALVVDAFIDLKDEKQITFPIIFEAMIGAFMFSEHLYLYQMFLRNVISF